MLTTGQLEPFFPDLSDERVVSAIGLVHSRFSTNTFPSWPLAHPYRMIAHNGEINTVMGNRNWMRAREAMLTSDLIPGDLSRLYPICTPGASDSASFDEVLELLHLGGRSLPHAVLMMIPEAWENHTEMDPDRRAFYEFHATSWSRGTARPTCPSPTAPSSAPCWTATACVRAASGSPTTAWSSWARRPACSTSTRPAVVRKGRLQPGRMFLVDTAQGRILEDDEIKASLAAEHPYGEWLANGVIHLDDLPEREHIVYSRESVLRRQQSFGYTEEELRILLSPMAKNGMEPIGSMGTDTPIAAISDRPRNIFDYFSQLFAQVTNPPLDAIREEIVTSLGTYIGPEGNLLETEPEQCRQVRLPFPVIDNDELAKLAAHQRRRRPARAVGRPGAAASTRCTAAGEALRRRDRRHLQRGRRPHPPGQAVHHPVPARRRRRERRRSLRCCSPSAVHHHLVREKTRTMVGIIVEAGDVREVHHVALLIGYGAAAVNPYLAMETVENLARAGRLGDVAPEKAVRNLVKALGKGVLKVMSKMGVSTVASYCGAQIFEAIGLSQEVIDRYFTGTTSKLGGVGLDVLAEEVAQRHAVAYPPSGISPAHRRLVVGGEYQWRREGEPHLFDPETVFKLQHSTRTKQFDIFRDYTHRWTTRIAAADDAARPVRLRRRGATAGARSRRSSPSARSSSASPPAPCPTAPSPPRRTRRWPSR